MISDKIYGKGAFYVERSKTMKGINLCVECANYNFKKHKCTISKDYGYVADSFYKDCPRPDVEKVKRGSWVDAYISGVHHYRCTSCGEYTEAIWHSNFDYNFCPNCGAKMDGEKEK